MDQDDRIRELEQARTNLATRLEIVEGQQSAIWTEVNRLRREQRDEYKALRSEQKGDTEKIMAAITANKIAWSMLNSGTKVAAWIILAMLSLGATVAGVASAVKRFFT